MKSKEYLRRIDKRDYLTEREHREYLEQLEKDLEKLEQYETIFNEPLKDIRERLRVLGILKEWCLKDFIEYSPNDYGWIEFPLTIYDTDTEEEANKKKIVVDYLKKC